MNTAFFFLGIIQCQEMAFISHNAGQFDTGQRFELSGQFQGRLLGSNANPFQADVYFDDYAQLLSTGGHCLANGKGLVNMVNTNDGICCFSQLDQSLDLGRSHDQVGNQQVLDSTGCHDFRFTQLGTRDPEGPGFHELLADQG